MGSRASLASLAKWMSVCLRAKWLCVRVSLQSLSRALVCPIDKIVSLVELEDKVRSPVERL